MITNAIYVSPLGLTKLREGLKAAEGAYREACAESARACELSGDGWHDNPHFNHCRQLEAALNAEVARLRDLNDRAVLLDSMASRAMDRVHIGSRVRLLIFDLKAQREEEQIWRIVGFGEGERASRKVAYNAPLAAAILGRTVGDSVDVNLGGREVEIEVAEVMSSVQATPKPAAAGT